MLAGRVGYYIYRTTRITDATGFLFRSCAGAAALSDAAKDGETTVS